MFESTASEASNKVNGSEPTLVLGWQRNHLFLAVLCLFWCASVSFGWLLISNYSYRNGELTQPPTQWPLDSSLRFSTQRSRLVVFAHPRCPCTNATLSELERLLARDFEKLETIVVFEKPAIAPEGWERTKLYQTAGAIEGVTTFIDMGGAEAKRFHANTSGVALLYDPLGRLVFHGGLTSARGHEGENQGLASLRDYLQGVEPRIERSCVYGCPLQSPDADSSKETAYVAN